MRKHIKRRIVFAGRSLAWAVLLFVTVMVLLNWNDVRSTVSGSYVTISNAQGTVISKINLSPFAPIRQFLEKGHALLRSASGISSWVY